MKRREVLHITDAAAARLREMLKKQPDAEGVVVGTRTRGCSGLSYTLEFRVRPQQQQQQQQKAQRGVQAKVAEASAMAGSSSSSSLSAMKEMEDGTQRVEKESIAVMGHQMSAVAADLDAAKKKEQQIRAAAGLGNVVAPKMNLGLIKKNDADVLAAATAARKELNEMSLTVADRSPSPTGSEKQESSTTEAAAPVPAPKEKKKKSRFAGEEKVEYGGVTVFIEPKSLIHIVGTTMDYVENDVKSGFEFMNPNSKGSCGCGESFNI